MIILCIYYIILSFPVSLPLQMIEKTEVMLISKLTLFYHLIMSVILVQIWGIVGVALSTTSAVLLKKVFEYFASKKYIQITFPWADIFKIVFNSVVVGLLAYWTRPFITDLITLVISFLVIMVVYLWVSYLNMAFIREERKLINQFFGKPYFRLLVGS
jgi:O-antigen/teichoic acid export membrane protein